MKVYLLSADANDWIPCMHELRRLGAIRSNASSWFVSFSGSAAEPSGLFSSIHHVIVEISADCVVC
jgi:hypothetical protein